MSDGGRGYDGTGSSSVSASTTRSMANAVRVLARADAVMYGVERAGGNGVRVLGFADGSVEVDPVTAPGRS